MNKIDPICGMKGTIPAHGHYFCSEHCIKKYEEQHGIFGENKYCPSCAVKAGAPWYKEKLFIVTFVTLILLLIGYFHPLLKPFFDSFIDYLILIWWAILLGFFIGGIIGAVLGFLIGIGGRFFVRRAIHNVGRFVVKCKSGIA